MRKLLIAVSALIIYGSLYPFNFDPDAYDASLLPELFYFGLGRVGRGDFVSNIVLFVPFGFLAMQSARGRISWKTWVLALASGFIIAHGIQVVQLVVPGRVPSGSDTTLNMLGCVLGCLLGMIRAPQVKGSSQLSAGPLPVPTLLAVFLLAWNLRPFIPSLDLSLVVGHIKHLVYSPVPDPLWTFQGVVTWLVIFHFLDGGGVKLIEEKYYPLLVLVTLCLGFFIVGNSMTIDRIAGGLLALPLWLILRSLPRPAILSVMMLVLILGVSFTPFLLRGEPSRFNWVPFSGALDGNVFIAVLATTKKMLLYGSLIYLLVQLKLHLGVSTAIVTLLLFISELLQVFVQGKTPEITDALLALMIGIGFSFWEAYRRKLGLPGKLLTDTIAGSPGSQGPHQNSFEARTETVQVKDDPPEQPQAENGTPRELIFNLHRSQAKFLQLLASATDLEIAEVCQRLIDLTASPGAEWQSDLLYSPEVQDKLGSFAREAVNRNWDQVTIELNETYFDRLSALAEDSGASTSKTMRLLLADCMRKSGIASRRRRNSRRSRSTLKVLLRSRPLTAAAIVAVLAAVSIAFYYASREGGTVRVGPHWAGDQASVIFDPHTHTRYSDGALSPAKLVDMAVAGGCDALAITDHSDTEGTVSERQMREHQSLRGKYPDLLLFNGIELNMPSYNGREHATLIADPSVETATLQQFRHAAENKRKTAKNRRDPTASDLELLQMIADYQSIRQSLLLVYNHPARKDPDIAENRTDIEKWNTRSAIFTAFEGAPGHQNDRVIGSYRRPYLTEDRWDPVVSTVGGVWDELLSSGHQLWGALASSDYHNSKLDKAPCAFSRTHLVVPEQSYRGVLKALRSGTFWADHGRIVDQLWFAIDIEGFEKTAYPGFVIDVGNRDNVANVTLAIERGPGSIGAPLTVEFIGNCVTGESEVLVVEKIPPGESAVSALIPLAATGRDGESCILRARVRLNRDSPTDYLAYTNPIRLILD